MNRIKNKITLLSAVLLLLYGIIAAAQPVTFNFEKVDIRTVISTVSELTGKNFVVSNKVSGKVTVISSKALSSKEIYQVFLSVLEVHGFSAVPSGTVIKIVRSSKAKRDTIPTVDGVNGNQWVTRVIHVKNVSALQLTPILRPLMPTHAHLGAYNATNTLIITDRSDNVRRLIKIIRRIDKVGDSDVDVVPLRHASASEVVRILNFLNRTYYKGRNAKKNVRVAADVRTNSVLVSGEKPSRVRMRAIIGHMDTPLHSGGNTHVLYLKFVKAKDLVPILKGVSNSIISKKVKGRPVSVGSSKLVNIQADERTNSIIVTAPPDTFRSLKQVISRLDIRRSQVLVEAIIAEVSADKARELGVQWFIGSKSKGVGSATNFSNSSNGGIGNFARSVNDKQIPTLSDGLNLVLGRLSGSRTSVGVLINALKADTKTNILSTPSIVTLDNQKAEIVVGQNVPFVTGSFTNNGSGGGSNGSVNPFQTIKRQDVGITLRVTPQINHGNAIQLDIDQEVSSISPSASAAKDIVTNKRSIKTTVIVENGQVIVLGGLIDNRLTKVNHKVPVLGSIPLLGKLFRYKKTSKEKRNLMVFLRPVILKDSATSTSVTNSKYRSIREQQLLLRARGAYGLRKADTPLLNKNIKNITNTPVPQINDIRPGKSNKPTNSSGKVNQTEKAKPVARHSAKTVVSRDTAETNPATQGNYINPAAKANKDSNEGYYEGD